MVMLTCWLVCVCLSIHLCVTMPTTKEGVADTFIADVKECVAEIMKDPKADCGGAVSL